MHFLKNGAKVTKGFRVSEHDTRMIKSFLGTDTGTLVVNLIRVSDGHKDYGISAIWTSGKIRIVDHRVAVSEDDSYVVEVVSIKHRQKGERV